MQTLGASASRAGTLETGPLGVRDHIARSPHEDHIGSLEPERRGGALGTGFEEPHRTAAAAEPGRKRSNHGERNPRLSSARQVTSCAPGTYPPMCCGYFKYWRTLSTAGASNSTRHSAPRSPPAAPARSCSPAPVDGEGVREHLAGPRSSQPGLPLMIFYRGHWSPGWSMAAKKEKWAANGLAIGPSWGV